MRTTTNMGKFFFFFSLSILLLLLISPNILTPKPLMADALPLHTDSRWIVDENGQRVKLACVNWVSHLEVLVAEGLSYQPVDVISKRILSMGFNCVRLTWPLFLATNDSLAAITVKQSFKNLGLVEALAGFQVNNPSMIDLSLINAFQVYIFLSLFFYFPGKSIHYANIKRKSKKVKKLNFLSRSLQSHRPHPQISEQGTKIITVIYFQPIWLCNGLGSKT